MLSGLYQTAALVPRISLKLIRLRGLMRGTVWIVSEHSTSGFQIACTSFGSFRSRTWKDIFLSLLRVKIGSAYSSPALFLSGSIWDQTTAVSDTDLLGNPAGEVLYFLFLYENKIKFQSVLQMCNIYSREFTSISNLKRTLSTLFQKSSSIYLPPYHCFFWDGAKASDENFTANLSRFTWWY